MRRASLAGLFAVIALMAAEPATHASPTMIRLGYPRCVPCHVSAQGGGLLTAYGRAVDDAQSARAGEWAPRGIGALFEERGLRQDFRAIVRAAGAGEAMDYSAQAAARLNLRVSDEVLVSAIVAGSSRPPPGRERAEVVKLAAEWRPVEPLEVVIGRDETPEPIRLADAGAFVRRGGTPLQARVTLAGARAQVIPWVSFDEETRESGGGVIAEGGGRNVVLGASLSVAHGAERDRGIGGVFARAGFGAWGILAQHDRERGTGRRHASYLNVFAAPLEWLVPSITVENADDVWRAGPDVALRVTPNATIVLRARHDGREIAHGLTILVKAPD